MTLIEAAKTGCQKDVECAGRASRQEYWKLVLAMPIGALVITIISGALLGSISQDGVFE